MPFFSEKVNKNNITSAYIFQDRSFFFKMQFTKSKYCLLYTSDAADDMQCVDLGGRRIIKKIC